MKDPLSREREERRREEEEVIVFPKDEGDGRDQEKKERKNFL